MMSADRRIKVLAVASGGGHWIQLLRLRPAFAGAEVVYASTDAPGNLQKLGGRFHRLRDANQDTKIALLFSAVQIFLMVARERPDVVVSTGAAPGYLAVLFGSLLGARTLWVDSIANAGCISKSGRLARRRSTLFLTQWERLATDDGVRYEGAVI
jgi:UDP-N-acetylglucosamine:LPS N-acetylglucosamine transferase